jgi:pyruvate decarboxylase
VEVLKGSVKPVILAGPRLRRNHRRDGLLALADASKYAVAVLPDAKGMFPESHEGFIGTYWGAVSSPCCCETVEAADIVITIGAVWTDYTTVGYSLLLKRSKVIRLEDNRVTILDGKTFGCINVEDFLEALAKVVPPNDSAVVNYRRMFVPLSLPEQQAPDEPLKTIVLMKHVQDMLTSDMALVAEVGDSWFNSQKLKLPDGCGYELQLRYGSIGWSVGAVLGYALASKTTKRVLALIGDGSFQMTAQEVSTMLRYNANPIILLINNGGYTIEVEIHDGPYNQIKNWNYTALIEAFQNKEGALWTAKVQTEPELKAALQKAQEHHDKLCFIEVLVHRDDCSRELLEWGSRVASANSRPPNPQ